ncbi:MAG: Rne/Rng family ribonuclease [Acidimicrobiales bacterium]
MAQSEPGNEADDRASTGGEEAAAPPPARSTEASASADSPAATKPKIGDSRPVPKTPPPRSKKPGDADRSQDDSTNGGGADADGSGTSASAKRRRRRRRKRAAEAGEQVGTAERADDGGDADRSGGAARSGGDQQSDRQRSNKQPSGQPKQDGHGNQQGGDGNRRNRSRKKRGPVEQIVAEGPVELDEQQLKRRRGRSRKGRPVGRYTMVVSKRNDATHIAVLEGRNLIEYYVSRPSDDVFQIHGNIYLGRVQNVLPGMEAAFVDIGTPKNAVLYRGDVTFDKSEFPDTKGQPKIEEMLKARQMVLCQVTKNPIAHKGARLTTEVSLPGRFVVLVPNSDTYGISKRLPDNERKRLRQILDKARPKGHGLIVRTAAENVTAEEIERDVAALVQQWRQIESMAAKTKGVKLLYREPDLSTRVIREEFNKDYRGVIIDDQKLHDEVAEYVGIITPALADRVEYYDTDAERIPAFERYHVHEQLHKALDRKVWLKSGGSLIIEATEALTVIDVNTGKNVGSSSLEETVFRNNLEAAEEVAHQLRLRDIGGIIVIDFVDMEDRKNRDEVVRVFRKALSRDKTRTQVFDISELGLVEMTRKRIGEGLLESLSTACPHCDGRGLQLEESVRSR